MSELQKRFGLLVAAHRKRRGWTQAELAECAELSVDMISRVETGATGVRFPSINKLSNALEVDPAELFSPDIPDSILRRPKLTEITSRIARLSDDDLDWLDGVLAAVLKHR